MSLRAMYTASESESERLSTKAVAASTMIKGVKCRYI